MEGLGGAHATGGTTSFHYGGLTLNVTAFSVSAFTACIWPDGPTGMPVPIIELVAHAVLLISITCAMIRVAFRRRQGPHKYVVSDAWLPVSADDFTGVMRLLTVVVGLEVAAALLTVAVMVLPITHNGAFVTSVYARESPPPPPPRALPPSSPHGLRTRLRRFVPPLPPRRARALRAFDDTP